MASKWKLMYAVMNDKDWVTELGKLKYNNNTVRWSILKIFFCKYRLFLKNLKNF